MAVWNVGRKNGMWAGGHSLASNGYVLVRVGMGHHLADVRGYAYEHRLVAERKLGRRLRRGEQVHHIDGDKTNNAASNLLVCSHAEHHVHHRSGSRRLRMPGEPNQDVACECGCGETFPRFDSAGRLRRFVPGHNGRRRR